MGSFSGMMGGLVCALLALGPQLKLPPPHEAPLPDTYAGQAEDLVLARRFAPVFHQRLTPHEEHHRFDFLTNFDFDGDWIGNNNWEHAADPKFPMKAYVYYSVMETESHYFITYAAFHARDWSALFPLMDSAMDRVQQSEKLAQYLPPELREQIEVNHENDLEGAQVIVAKPPAPQGAEAVAGARALRVVGVETLAHDRFTHYLPGELLFEGDHPELYVESQKHGIHKYPYTAQGAVSLFDTSAGPLRAYRHKGVAEDPAKVEGDVGYDLLPLYGTLWKRARSLRGPDQTFGEVINPGDLFCHILGKLAARVGPRCRITVLGTALRGDVAGKNRAKLPWDWSSLAEPELSNGAWFLDPARILRLHFPEERRSEQYVSNPFLGVFR